MNQFQQQPPLSQNRNPHYDAASEMMELSNWEASNEPNARSSIIDDIQKLRDKVRNGNDVLANLIGNASDME